MNDKRIVTDQEVLEMAEQSLTEALPLECAGYQCQSIKYWSVDY